MKLLLSISFFLLSALSSNAQSTLGLSIGELHALYDKASVMTSWERGTTASGQTYVKMLDTRDNTLIVSYFTSDALADKLVNATAVYGPTEPFLDIFIAKCNKLYQKTGDLTWKDPANPIRITVTNIEGVAVMTFSPVK